MLKTESSQQGGGGTVFSCAFGLKRPLLSGDNSFEFSLQRWLKPMFGASSHGCASP